MSFSACAYVMSGSRSTIVRYSRSWSRRRLSACLRPASADCSDAQPRSRRLRNPSRSRAPAARSPHRPRQNPRRWPDITERAHDRGHDERRRQQGSHRRPCGTVAYQDRGHAALGTRAADADGQQQEGGRGMSGHGAEGLEYVHRLDLVDVPEQHGRGERADRTRQQAGRPPAARSPIQVSSAADVSTKASAVCGLILPGATVIADPVASRNRSWSMPTFDPVMCSMRVTIPIRPTGTAHARPARR